MAYRFYCPKAAKGGVLVLDRDEARHLDRVRRVPVGARVELFDGDGFATRAEVVEIGRDRVKLTPVGEPLPGRELPYSLSLAVAVPKGERFDWLVEKTAEAGVSLLLPIMTARAVVEPRWTKLERVRRAVVETSKQCGRNVLMEVVYPLELAVILKASEHEVKLMAHPGGLSFPDWPEVPEGSRVMLAVGPEGGFTDEEAELARSTGWSLVSLGPSLLRVETAALVGAAMVTARAACSRPPSRRVETEGDGR